MDLLVEREPSTAESTIGRLSIAGVFECYTLEDPIRSEKIPGRTAIPAGRYRVVITYSIRFQKLLPQLLNVPKFLGVRIHGGNRAADTEGCILVGQRRGDDAIFESQIALAALQRKLEKTLTFDTVWLEVRNADHEKTA